MGSIVSHHSYAVVAIMLYRKRLEYPSASKGQSNGLNR
jgi:hypothetical protein